MVNYEYPITYQLIKDGRKNRVLNKKINSKINMYYGSWSIKMRLYLVIYSKKSFKTISKSKKKINYCKKW